MASIKITRHEHTSVRTVRNTVQADGVTVSDHSDVTVETIRARFEIVGGEPFSRKGRSTQMIRPEGLEIKFKSVNGDPWKWEYGVDLTGSNIKKDGTLGAGVDINQYDFPDWAKALFDSNDSAAMEWVRVEYPR